MGIRNLKRKRKNVRLPAAIKAKQAKIRNELVIADQYQETGQLEAAERIYRQVLNIDPQHSHALHMLSVFAYHGGYYEMAVVLLNRSLLKDSRNPILYNNIGQALFALGKMEDALSAYQQAITLGEENAEFYNNYGTVLSARKQYNEAIESFQTALEIEPAFAEAANNLGDTYQLTGKLDEAQLWYNRALDIEPDLPMKFTRLARSMAKLRKYEEATSWYKKAIQLNPDAADAYNDLGVTYINRGMADKALIIFKKALQLNPDFSEAYGNMGHALAYQGKTDKAISCYKKALQLQPEFSTAFKALVHSRVYTDEHHEDVILGKRILQNSDLSDENILEVHFALGKIYDDCKMYKTAFDHYRRANSIKHKTSHLDHNAPVSYVSRIIKTFPVTFKRYSNFAGSESKLPVFIVGMPRSGTSLVEQIIAAHPKVHGAGELNIIDDIVSKLTIGLQSASPGRKYLSRVDQNLATSLSRFYLAQLQQDATDLSIRISDKMVQNCFHLGWISLLFPKAKIIHCSRHPLDTCLSIYFQYFTGEHPYAYDLSEIGIYYREYERIMAHWRKALPASIHEIKYEDLLNDQATNTRKLIDFLELEWDDACLSFQKNSRAVFTASAWQVRQPIYNKSVGRWRNYEEYLRPLKDALGMA